ncbi:MAG: YbdK family carboxylate-amine ligase [Propionicimonas sp.]
MRTVGVEEEFLLVDEAGAPVGLAQEAVGVGVERELKEEMLETGTEPCLSLRDLAAEVRRQRRVAGAAAEAAGARLAALATSPLPVTSSVTAAFRYRRIAAEYGLTAREQLTCGCHVHVQVADDEEGVAVLDRIGRWLPILLAMSTNSPFWNGIDSGYASYRSQVWQRWPTAGPTGAFGSAADYHRVLAALARALVETAAQQPADGVQLQPVRPELLRGAGWRAGRAGLRGPLVHPERLTQVPAAEAVSALLDHVRPALVEAGELDLVTAAWQRLLARGSGSEEQRVWAVDGPPAVVAAAVQATRA